MNDPHNQLVTRYRRIVATTIGAVILYAVSTIFIVTTAITHANIGMTIFIVACAVHVGSFITGLTGFFAWNKTEKQLRDI